MFEGLWKMLPLGDIASGLINLVWPKAPAWVGPFTGALGQLAKEMVEELTDEEYRALDGSAKMAKVVELVKEELDDGFDDIPAWTDLSEVKRDRIITGLAELILFIHRATYKGTRKSLVDTKRALRTMRKSLRRTGVGVNDLSAED